MIKTNTWIRSCLIVLLCVVMAFQKLNAQQLISLAKPFELLSDFAFCAGDPDQGPAWGATATAFSGSYFIGFHEFNYASSGEAFSGLLNQTLVSGQVYKYEVMATIAPITNFNWVSSGGGNHDGVIYLYAGNSSCAKSQLIDSIRLFTPADVNTWKKFSFTFTATGNYTHLAFYAKKEPQQYINCAYMGLDDVSSAVPPVSNFLASDSTPCANDCISFSDLSTGATSWEWIFDGAMPATSTDQNPPMVCYTSPGKFDVTLIASNAGGADTLKLADLITVNDAPPTPVITVSNDTLYSSIDPSYIYYQWYDSTVLIAGATMPYYKALHSGNYNLQVNNIFGCQIAVGINFVITATEDVLPSVIELYPNPAHDEFVIKGKYEDMEMFNVLGENMRGAFTLKSDNAILQPVDISTFSAGLYFVKVKNSYGVRIYKLLKE